MKVLVPLIHKKSKRELIRHSSTVRLQAGEKTEQLIARLVVDTAVCI